MFLVTLLLCNCYLFAGSRNAAASNPLGDAEDRCPNPNEVWTACAPACRSYCKQPLMHLDCFQRDTSECFPACICKSGFIREIHTSRCISNSQCVDPCPNPNEVWNDCGTYCPAYCGEPDPRLRACPASCRRDCFCKSGFIRERATGRCISNRQCATLSNSYDSPQV